MYDQIVMASTALADSTSGNAQNPPSSTLIIIAIVSALGLVLAAAFPALLTMREREPRAARDMRSQRDKLQRKNDWKDHYIEELQALAWQHGLDPLAVKPEGEP